MSPVRLTDTDSTEAPYVANRFTLVKVLVAPDKFKGSLTAGEVVHSLGRGLRKRGIAYRGLPLADGGDGSVQAAVAAGCRSIDVEVASATGQRHRAAVAFDGTTAVVEVANTCGLHTLPDGKPAPLTASSTGFGEAIRAALDMRATRIILALGGSASTDGGAGMLAALGVQFRDQAGRPLQVDGGSLREIHSVDAASLPDLRHVEIVIACDVSNPLTGATGAAAVYGPQKGARQAEIVDLEAGLANLIDRLALWHPIASSSAGAAGAGAAGGIAFGAMLLGGRIVSGADYFLDLLQFESHLLDCDLVITGEGRIDEQTRYGKLPAVVARRAAPLPTIAVVGRNDISSASMAAIGLHAVHALTDHTLDNPADDPDLSRQLLEELGASMPLPTDLGGRPR